MKKFDTYTKRIQWRIRGLWMVVAGMLVYMVVIGETGGGDSRIMTDFAKIVSRVIFFGGLAFVIFRIVRYKKQLKNRELLKEQLRNEQDERNQYLHDKSGGIVLDILLVALLFLTLTTSLFHMVAFYTSFAILALAVLLKIGAYQIFLRS